MESGLNGERAKKRGAERLQSPERLSLSGGVWGEEPQKTNAKHKCEARKKAICLFPATARVAEGNASSEGKPAKAWKSPFPARTSSKSRKAARALRGSWPKHGKALFRPAAARAAKRRTVSASKPRGSWVRDGSSLPRKYPGCEVICFAWSRLSYHCLLPRDLSAGVPCASGTQSRHRPKRQRRTLRHSRK